MWPHVGHAGASPIMSPNAACAEAVLAAALSSADIAGAACMAPFAEPLATALATGLAAPLLLAADAIAAPDPLLARWLHLAHLR